MFDRENCKGKFQNSNYHKGLREIRKICVDKLDITNYYVLRLLVLSNVCDFFCFRGCKSEEEKYAFLGARIRRQEDEVFWLERSARHLWRSIIVRTIYHYV